MLAITSPYPQLFDLDGSPLDGGKVYFGNLGTNPVVESNRIPVYWDEAGTQPATQPVTTSNGYIYRAGTPAVLFANTAYSIAVYNKAGKLVATAKDAQAGSGFSVGLQLAQYQAEQLSGAGASNVGFVQAGTGAVPTTIQAILRQDVSVLQFGAIGDGAYHPLSERFASLIAAQAVYPHATALTDSIDWCALQAAINFLNPYTWGGSIGQTSQGGGIGQQPGAANITRGGCVSLHRLVLVVNRPVLLAPNVVLEGDNCVFNVSDMYYALTATNSPGAVIIGRGFANPAQYVVDTAPYDASGTRQTAFSYIAPPNAKDNVTATYCPRTGLRNVIVTTDSSDTTNEVYGGVRLSVVAYSVMDNVCARARYVGIARHVSFECDWGRVISYSFIGLSLINCLKLTVKYWAPLVYNIRIATATDTGRTSAYYVGGLEEIVANKQKMPVGMLAAYADVDVLSCGQAESLGSYLTLATSIVSMAGGYEERTGWNQSGWYDSIPIADRSVFTLIKESYLYAPSLMSKSTGDDTRALVNAESSCQAIFPSPKYITGHRMFQPLGGEGAYIELSGLRYDLVKGYQDYGRNLTFSNDCQLKFDPVYVDGIFPFDNDTYDYIIWVNAITGDPVMSGLHTTYPTTIYGAWKFLWRNGRGKRVRLVMQGVSAEQFNVPLNMPTVQDCDIEMVWTANGSNIKPYLTNPPVGGVSPYLPIRNCKLKIDNVNMGAQEPASGTEVALWRCEGQCHFDVRQSNMGITLNSSFIGSMGVGASVTMTAFYVNIGSTGASGKFATGLWSGDDSPLLWADACRIFSLAPGVIMGTNVRKIRSDIVP